MNEKLCTGWWNCARVTYARSPGAGGRPAGHSLINYSATHTHTHTLKQPEECGQLPTPWVRRRAPGNLPRRHSLLTTSKHHCTPTIPPVYPCVGNVSHHSLVRVHYTHTHKFFTVFQQLSALYCTPHGTERGRSSRPRRVAGYSAPNVHNVNHAVFLWMGVGHHEWIDDTHSVWRGDTNVPDVDSIDVFVARCVLV